MNNQIYQIPREVNTVRNLLAMDNLLKQNEPLVVQREARELEVVRTTEPPVDIRSQLSPSPSEPQKTNPKKEKKKRSLVDWLIIVTILGVLITGAILGATNPELKKDRLCKSHDLIYDKRGFCYSPDGSETLELHEIQEVNGEFIIGISG